jgi:hypothetical protein
VKLNWLHKKIAEWTRIIRFSIEQANRDALHKGIAIGIEQGKRESPDCLACPLYRVAHSPIQLTPYERPSPITTSGKLAVVMGAREVAWRRQLNSQPSGKLLLHDSTMKRQKMITRQLDPETVNLPSIKPPGSSEC